MRKEKDIDNAERKRPKQKADEHGSHIARACTSSEQKDLGHHIHRKSGEWAGDCEVRNKISHLLK